MYPGSAGSILQCLQSSLPLSFVSRTPRRRGGILSLFQPPLPRLALSPKSARSRARCSPRHILISVHGTADSTMPNPRVHTSLTGWNGDIGLPDPDSSGSTATLEEDFSSKLTCEGCDVLMACLITSDWLSYVMQDGGRDFYSLSKSGKRAYSCLCSNYAIKVIAMRRLQRPRFGCRIITRQ